MRGLSKVSLGIGQIRLVSKLGVARLPRAEALRLSGWGILVYRPEGRGEVL